MMLSTMLLIANLVALIFAEPFMSFWWIAIIYVTEIAVYILIFVILCVIAAMASD